MVLRRRFTLLSFVALLVLRNSKIVVCCNLSISNVQFHDSTEIFTLSLSPTKTTLDAGSLEMDPHFNQAIT